MALVVSAPWAARWTAARAATPSTPAASAGDPAGRFAGRYGGQPEAGADTLGTPCGSCPNPTQASYFGVGFRGADMWLVANDGTMYRMDGCGVIETVSIQGFRGFATDLGWDSRRGLFIVTDPELDQVLTVRPDGVVTNAWPSPLTGPIGAAYDSTRDVYWIADWEENQIHPVDPVTGAPGAGFAVPAGTRIAGLGYDASRDALYYNGRNQRTCYAASAATHALLGSFGLPSPGFENGEGLGVAPDGRLWIHLYELARIACFESDLPTPVRSTSWGELKRRYLR